MDKYKVESYLLLHWDFDYKIQIQKHIYIEGICYSSDSGTLGARSDRGNGKDKVPAARLIPSEPNNNVVPANNVRIYVENTGNIYGSAGIGGYDNTGGYENGAPKKRWWNCFKDIPYWRI